ncbi:iron complex outermembrane recepter protein [Mariprofundus aestuarium]|uniref:Iron complex outermembrane recepter protein n=1 Tax=Mariprofundus aestuarium TaxID=1921086 RepID=A0A2K8KWK0_MARES|nr:TonB-dependent receptor [Mariprofundus aestuarium]ATX79247.1 iron complex outermembrane recepter protein [Mariprofundus aestuarium]
MIHTHYRQVFLAALIATCTYGVALAEDAAGPVIDVTGSALTDTQAPHCDIVSQQELKSMAPATSDSASLLQNTPGLNLQGGGGVSSLPVLHGLADDRLRIKVDGMDLVSACANHMNPPLSYIDPSNVGSAAVFAGISPVSVGGDSIGGTILVESESPEFAKPGEGSLIKGQIGTFYRSNGNVLGGNVSATAATETASIRYNGSTVKASKNYKAGGDFKAAGLAAVDRGWLAADEVGSSRYESTNHALAIGVLKSNHLIDLKLGLQDIPNQGWTNQRMDMTGNKSTQANLGVTSEFDWGNLESRVYFENTRHSMQFGEDKQYQYGTVMMPVNGMPMDTEGKNIGASLKANVALSSADQLRVGAEYQQYRLDDWWNPSGGMMMAPNVFLNINGGKRDRMAVYGEWESQISSSLLTQLGLRFERVDMNTDVVQGYNTMMAFQGAEAAAFNAANRKKVDNNVDATALARFTPDENKTIEFGYGMKTRSPNLYERYTWSTAGMMMRMVNLAGDGNGYVGNLNLNPETSHTISATVDLHDADERKWGFKMTPYYTYVNDYVDAARCSSANMNCGMMNQTATNAFVYLQFVNQKAEMYGVDVSGDFIVSEGSYGSVTAKGLMNYVRGKNKTTGDNLYNIMPMNGHVALEHNLGGWTGTVDVEMVAAKKKVSQTRNEMTTAGYALVNLHGAYKWNQVRFDLGVSNLLDRFYNHPLGGAYLGQGMTMGTAVPWGVPVPGMGRSIYVGMTVNL